MQTVCTVERLPSAVIWEFQMKLNEEVDIVKRILQISRPEEDPDLRIAPHLGGGQIRQIDGASINLKEETELLDRCRKDRRIQKFWVPGKIMVESADTPSNIRMEAAKEKIPFYMGGDDKVFRDHNTGEPLDDQKYEGPVLVSIDNKQTKMHTWIDKSGERAWSSLPRNEYQKRFGEGRSVSEAGIKGKGEFYLVQYPGGINVLPWADKAGLKELMQGLAPEGKTQVQIVNNTNGTSETIFEGPAKDFLKEFPIESTESVTEASKSVKIPGGLEQVIAWNTGDRVPVFSPTKLENWDHTVRVRLQVIGEKSVTESDLPFGIGKKVQDEVGPFYVVTKGTPESEIIDIMFDSTVPGMMLQSRGGLDVDDILLITPDQSKAKALADDVMKKLAGGDEGVINRKTRWAPGKFEGKDPVDTMNKVVEAADRLANFTNRLMESSNPERKAINEWLSGKILPFLEGVMDAYDPDNEDGDGEGMDDEGEGHDYDESEEIEGIKKASEKLTTCLNALEASLEKIEDKEAKKEIQDVIKDLTSASDELTDLLAMHGVNSEEGDDDEDEEGEEEGEQTEANAPGWGVRWAEFGRDDRVVNKEKIFKTEKAREAFAEKVSQKDNFKEFLAWSEPQTESASSSKEIKGVKFEIAGRQDGDWNSGMMVSIDGKKHHVIKQGGMNLWAFPGRPELEKKIGRDGIKEFDSWLGSELAKHEQTEASAQPAMDVKKIVDGMVGGLKELQDIEELKANSNRPDIKNAWYVDQNIYLVQNENDGYELWNEDAKVIKPREIVQSVMDLVGFDDDDGEVPPKPAEPTED